MKVLDLRQLIGEATEYDKSQALEANKPKSWCKQREDFCMNFKLEPIITKIW